MKSTGKVDTSYRITIPKDIRESVGLDIGTKVEIETGNNGNIIISFNSDKNNTVSVEDLPTGTKYWENGVLKVKLPDEEKEVCKVSDKKYEDLSDTQKTKIQELAKETLDDKYWENGILKSRLAQEDLIKQQESLLKQVSEVESKKPIYCECGNEITDCKFILNGKRICRACVNKLKGQLRQDIINRQKAIGIYRYNRK